MRSSRMQRNRVIGRIHLRSMYQETYEMLKESLEEILVEDTEVVSFSEWKEDFMKKGIENNCSIQLMEELNSRKN